MDILPKTPASTRRECLLFLCHHTKPVALAALEALVQQCRQIDVIPLFDVTHGPLDLVDIRNARSITCPDVTRILPYPVKHRHHPGTFWPKNIDLPLMWFFHVEPDYDYYWVIEYDVRFSGNWQVFFQHFTDNGSDLLATTLFDYDFRPRWPHWKALRSPIPVPLEARTRATLSFYRLSRRALQALHQGYTQRWGGHYEVTIPTLLKHQGFSLEDMGGNGAYVRPENINRFYTNTPANPGLAPGTFVLKQSQREKNIYPDMLYNPFK